MFLGKRLAWFSALMLVVLTGCVSTRENSLPNSSAPARWYRLRVAPYLQYTAFTEYSYAEQRSAARREAYARELERFSLHYKYLAAQKALNCGDWRKTRRLLTEMNNEP